MEIEDYDHKTEEGQREETFDSNEVERKTRKKVFLIMILINALLNYDTGVIPASLIQLGAWHFFLEKAIKQSPGTKLFKFETGEEMFNLLIL